MSGATSAADTGAAGVLPLTDVAATCGPRLPPRCVPLRRHERRDGDDGRRPLLARLRRRRLARPLRRQRVRRSRTSRAGSARGGLPTSRLYRNVGGRFEDVTKATGAGARASAAAAASRPTSTATARPTSSSRRPATTPAATRTTRSSGTTATGRSPRARGRRGHPHARLAHGRGGRGRERRRPARPLRRGLHRLNNARSRARRPASRRTTRRARPPLPQRGGQRGHPVFREVGRAAGLEPRRLDHGLGAVVPRRERRRPPRPLRRERPRPEPAVPERRAPSGGLGLPLRRARVASSGVDDPNAGMGIAVGDYSGDGLDDLLRDELTRPAARRLSRPRRRPVRGRAARIRRGRSGSGSPAGARPGPTSTSTAAWSSRSRTARSRSGASPRTPSASSCVTTGGTVRAARRRADRAPERTRPRGSRLRQRRRPRPGASARSAAPCSFCGTTGSTGHWLEVRCRASRRARESR